MLETIEQKETTEHLPCILTDIELLAVSRELARNHQDVQALMDKKAEFVSQVGADLKKKAAEIESNSLKISTGKEYRPIACVWEYRYDTGVKTLRRIDTQEVVRTEAITPAEREQNLL
jgi:hypothetical protein